MSNFPASCCGVVGYKPPRGRNPVDPPFNLDPYCHTGPLARSVADVLLLQNLLSGPHPDDPCTLPPHRIEVTEPSVRGLRVAVSSDLGFYPLDPEVAAALDDAVATFRDLGARVEEVDLPWGEEVQEAALTHLRLIFGTSVAPEADADWDRMTPYARAFARAGLAVTPREYYRALGVAGDAGRSLGAAMAGVDLLICPTTAIPAVPAAFDPGTDRLEIGGRRVNPMLGWVMTPAFSMLSSYPVLAVPMGRATSGVPIGLQIVGRPYDDDTVFRAGLAWEAARGPWPPSAVRTTGAASAGTKATV